MTVALARTHRFAVEETIARNHIKRMGPYLESWRESVLRGVGIPGAQDTVSYILLGAAAAGYQSDAASEAMAHYLKARQLPDGHWRVAAHRPPMESSDFEVTAASTMQSDAYATGQVLVALRETGVLTVTSPAYARGVAVPAEHTA